MSEETPEAMNSIVARLLRAITEVDFPTIETSCTPTVELHVPGARDVDLTQRSQGCEALSAWAETVHNLCGMTRFVMQRYFENGCETMAAGTIEIVRLPRRFASPCSVHTRFEGSRIATFQLLLDTYALEKFRGGMD